MSKNKSKSKNETFMLLKYFLGFDGGGTHLRGCLIDESGSVLAAAAQPPASFPKLKEKIGAPVAELANALKKIAGLSHATISAAGFCSTGVGRPADRAIVERALNEKNIAQKIIAESDALAALTGAFGGGPGIIVIAGTGVICFGRAPGGEIIRVGGWGYLLGDEGSGFSVAQAGLIAALKNWDGRGAPTMLREIFEKRFNVVSIELLISQIYSPEFDRGKFAELAPLVFSAADQGDAVAQEIIRNSGRAHGHLIRAVLQRATWPIPVPLALIGNLFRRRDVLLPGLWEILPEKELALIAPRFEPVVGAALLAMMATGVSLNEDFLMKLERSWQAKSS
ncbi:MAG: N-acetylmuramic acid/N-acetylglucosamine kinase [bacterium]|nr:N-acetylmuramic acid/N-acetylglucosamine kinase [bacterium]